MERLFKTITDLKWTIERECDTTYRLQKFSSAGQDFNIFVDSEGDNPELFIENLFACYENFDISYETYLWLDGSGHGRDGAPWDMRDLYNDMEECHESIYSLYRVLSRLDLDEELDDEESTVA